MDVRFSWEKAFSNEQDVLNLIEKDDGLTDREIAEKLNGLSVKTVKEICNQLKYKGRIDRVKVKGTEIKNHVIGSGAECLSINRAADLERMVLDVLSKDIGKAISQIKREVNRQGVYEYVIYEICRQLEYKGKTRSIEGEANIYYLK